MTSMERNIQEMLAKGASYDTIRTMLDEMEKAEKAAKDKHVVKAREAVINAIVEYLLTLGVVTKEELAEIDMDTIMEMLIQTENELLTLTSSMAKFGEFLGLKEPIKIKITPEPSDEDILKNFIQQFSH